MNNKNKIKDIYCITNLINGKQYVGQSNNPERRFKEHINSKCDSVIHWAIKKYGENNFELKILESKVRNFDEREKYWIKKLDTMVPNGYNVSEGGDFVPYNEGSDNYRSLINECAEYRIKFKLLPNPAYSISMIASLYGVTPAVINSINRGDTYHDDRINYPIRSKDWLYKKIFDLLQTQKCTLEEIRCMTYATMGLIKDINSGKKYHQDNCAYPIIKYTNKTRAYHEVRKNQDLMNSLISDEDIVRDIINDLSENDLSITQITLKYNMSRGVIMDINKGGIFKNSNIQYPIRPYTGRLKIIESDKLKDIVYDLQNTKLSIRNIRKKYGLTYNTVQRINNGDIPYRLDYIKYPIRDYKYAEKEKKRR